MDEQEEFDSNKTVIKLSQTTYLSLAAYLIIIGVVALYINGLVLVTFYRFRRLVTPTALFLINLAIADIGILTIIPLTTSSNIAQRWLFSDNVCQYYGFVAFITGTAHIGTLTLLALDRYYIAFGSQVRFRDKYNYLKWINVIWIYSLFWAIMPLFGWARYSIDINNSSCNIDWRHNDLYYKSFIIFYFLFGFMFPFIVISFCYWNIIKKVRHISAVDRNNAESNGEDIWAEEKTVTMMSVIITVLFVCTWSPYALLCLWTVFSDPSGVPVWLILIPPLFAKTSTLLNPLIYYLTNKKLRTALISSAFCRHISHPVIIEYQERSVCFINHTDL